jgi:hypothetical protein
VLIAVIFPLSSQGSRPPIGPLAGAVAFSQSFFAQDYASKIFYPAMRNSCKYMQHYAE